MDGVVSVNKFPTKKVNYQEKIPKGFIIAWHLL